MIKVDPRDLVVHQFQVIVERAEQYAIAMKGDANRINYCLGVALEQKGQIKHRQSGNRTIVELPHAEFVVSATPTGFNFAERDRYISVAPSGERLLLWGG